MGSHKRSESTHSSKSRKSVYTNQVSIKYKVTSLQMQLQGKAVESQIAQH